MTSLTLASVHWAARISATSNSSGVEKSYQAALVLGVLTLLCLIYLNRRIRAVEIVR